MQSISMGLKCCYRKRKKLKLSVQQLKGTAYSSNQTVSPDVVLTDLKMPGIDGIQAIKEITALKSRATASPSLPLIQDYLIIEALEAGAMGYITKNAQRDEIIEAIKTVNGHHAYYCRTTSLKLARQIAYSNFNPYKKAGADVFNDTEKEIIRLFVRKKQVKKLASNCLYLKER